MNWGNWEEFEIKEQPDTGDCRYCKHPQWQHGFDEKLGCYPCSDNSPLVTTSKRVSATSIIIPQQHKVDRCPCMEYVPGDNLAFLE